MERYCCPCAQAPDQRNARRAVLFRWRVSRIVSRLHVRELERPFAMNLNDRDTAGDRAMMRVFRHSNEAAGGEPLGAAIRMEGSVEAQGETLEDGSEESKSRCSLRYSL